MKSVGIIAEYNPCHLGHQYHIETTRTKSEADCVVAVMSGNFIQRGAPAFADKFFRAGCALLSGADLVIELPVIYASASAECFAAAGVAMLGLTNAVQFLSFGTESEQIAPLDRLAKLLAWESEDYVCRYKSNLSKGMHSAKAREQALSELYPDLPVHELLSTPNNILAVEYLKAIRKGAYDLTPIAVKRLGSNYHDTVLQESFSSASAVRHAVKEYGPDSIKNAVNPEVYDLFLKEYRHTLPVFSDSLDSLLQFALLQKERPLSDYADIDEKLSNRIKNLLTANEPLSFDKLCDTLKCRNYTYTHISRALMHIILNITKEDMSLCAVPQYARVLGFNQTGSSFLRHARKVSDIPFITDIAQAKKVLPKTALRCLRKDVYASKLYQILVNARFGTVINDDYRSRPVILR